jgi:KaiC/GvpD/RAD55 family RecA-like ATPase
MSKLESALAWAGRGFKVFPLAAGTKKPLFGESWPEISTTDPEQIMRWWRDELTGTPRDYNIGSDCSGWIVADLDRKNGKDGVREFEAMGGRLGETLTVRTTTGGFHAYFNSQGLDVANSAGAIAPGIDIRAFRGYTVAPGSVIESGSYELHADKPITDAPTFIWRGVKLAEPRRHDSASGATDTDANLAAAARLAAESAPAIEGAGGDLRTYQTACTVRDMGVSELAAWELLLEHWNPRCSPPWDADELRAKVANAYAYAQRAEGEKSSAAMFDGVNVPPPECVPSAYRSRLRMRSPSDCEQAPPRPYVVKGLLAAGDFGCIFGAPGAGKSVLAPHLCYAIAQGRPVFGRRSKPGRIFYVAAEDPAGMAARIQALRRRHGDAPLFSLVDGLAGSLAEPERLAELGELIRTERPALVVVDTLAAAFPAIDENGSKDMGLVVQAARSLARLGPAVLLVHHDTKDATGTPRGHSVFNGALDMALLVNRNQSGQVICQLTKNRNGACDERFGLKIESERLGFDEDGDAVSAPIAREMDPAAIRKAVKLPASENAVLLILRDLMADEGEEAPDGSGLRHLREERLRQACRESATVSASEKPDARRKATDRAILNLARRGLIAVEGDRVWEPCAPAASPEVINAFVGVTMPPD